MGANGCAEGIPSVFAQQRQRFALHLCLSIVLLSGPSMIHFPSIQMGTGATPTSVFIAMGDSYVCLTLLSCLCMSACFNFDSERRAIHRHNWVTPSSIWFMCWCMSG